MTRSKNVQPTPQPQSENSDSTLESLRKSEATTRALLNAVPDLVLKLDAAGTYLDFKAPIDFTIKGASPDTRLGRHLHDVLPKQVADQIVKAVGEALRTDEIQLLEYEIPRDDGIHTREGRIVACGDGEALLIVRDITARKRIEESLSKRAAELEIVAQISAAASSILDTEALLQKVTDLTQKHFGLYHAQVYFLNDVEHTLDLVAGVGEIGSKMVSQGWHIPLDREQSLVARAARTRQGVIVNDVTQDDGFLPQPLLPDTRSEMAIPLLVAGRTLGVLDVQSDEVDHFS
ncbi:MAG TPA: GAF domain-containing protein, partial [Anaerolineae bacterium]